MRVKQPTATERLPRNPFISGDGFQNRLPRLHQRRQRPTIWLANADGGSAIRLTIRRELAPHPNLMVAPLPRPNLFPRRRRQPPCRHGRRPRRHRPLHRRLLRQNDHSPGGTLPRNVRNQSELAGLCTRKLLRPQFPRAPTGKQVLRQVSPARSLSHCVMKEDLYALVSLMLGELNASHLGISGNLGAPEQQTADLGLLFDPTSQGPRTQDRRDRQGWPRRPRCRGPQSQEQGDLIVSIDGTRLTEKANVSQLLNDKVGEFESSCTSPAGNHDGIRSNDAAS